VREGKGTKGEEGAARIMTVSFMLPAANAYKGQTILGKESGIPRRPKGMYLAP